MVEEVAFARVDERLASYLLAAHDDSRVCRTHEAIASDLGTSREVVSRILKDFERHGWVVLGRGEVTVVMPEALAAKGSSGKNAAM